MVQNFSVFAFESFLILCSTCTAYYEWMKYNINVSWLSKAYNENVQSE